MKQNKSIEQELRLAKEYWLRTVQPHIAGRILRGVEFFVAQHAHWYLQKAVEKASDWNRLCADNADKKDGEHLPVSVDVDLLAENFREPEEPEMLFADNVKPEILAAVAASLVKKSMTPDEAIRNAHDLLMAAERYIGTLPDKTEGTESFMADFDTAFSYVAFAEIEKSNKTDSGQLPLLPPIGRKQKGMSKEQLRDSSPLSANAIKAAVKKFLQEQTPNLTKDDYEREQKQTEELIQKGIAVRLGTGEPMTYDEWQKNNQAAIDDQLNNRRILLQSLCGLRWERFKIIGRNNRTESLQGKPIKKPRPK